MESLVANELKRIGRVLQEHSFEKIQENLLTLVSEVESPKQKAERVLRFLLLSAILDQATVSAEARAAGLEVYDIFKESDIDLLNDPREAITEIDKLFAALERTGYRQSIGYAGGQIGTREAVLFDKVAGFLVYLMCLEKRKSSLREKITTMPPSDLEKDFKKSFALKAALKEKATRMYIGWVLHKDYKVVQRFIQHSHADPLAFHTPVDGHSGRVFCRTGVIDQEKISLERESGTGKKLDRIEAYRFRDDIDEKIHQCKGDPMRMDTAAFFLGKMCCDEFYPSCYECNFRYRSQPLNGCPIEDLGFCLGENCPLKEAYDCITSCILKKYISDGEPLCSGERCPLAEADCPKRTQYTAYKKYGIPNFQPGGRAAHECSLTDKKRELARNLRKSIKKPVKKEILKEKISGLSLHQCEFIVFLSASVFHKFYTSKKKTVQKTLSHNRQSPSFNLKELRSFTRKLPTTFFTEARKEFNTLDVPPSNRELRHIVTRQFLSVGLGTRMFIKSTKSVFISEKLPDLGPGYYQFVGLEQ
ncbi:MAG: hypothetical protein ACOC6G_03825 [Thermoproteota archaeon]